MPTVLVSELWFLGHLYLVVGAIVYAALRLTRLWHPTDWWRWVIAGIAWPWTIYAIQTGRWRLERRD